MLLLIVGVVGTCIAFAVEINQLKYETASLLDLNNGIKQFNTSILDSTLSQESNISPDVSQNDFIIFKI